MPAATSFSILRAIMGLLMCFCAARGSSCMSASTCVYWGRAWQLNQACLRVCQACMQSWMLCSSNSIPDFPPLAWRMTGSVRMPCTSGSCIARCCRCCRSSCKGGAGQVIGAAQRASLCSHGMLLAGYLGRRCNQCIASAYSIREQGQGSDASPGAVALTSDTSPRLSLLMASTQRIRPSRSSWSSVGGGGRISVTARAARSLDT